MRDLNMSSYELLKEEWLQVSRILNIDVEFDFEVNIQKFKAIKVPVFLPNFGHKNGTLLFSDPGFAPLVHESELGKCFGISYCGDDPGSEIRRSIAVYIDMLSEFGWSGSSEEKPEWLIEPYEPKDVEPDDDEGEWVIVNS